MSFDEKIADDFDTRNVLVNQPRDDRLFKGQEPGSDAEISNFCSINYDVHFPLFSKISVLGEDQRVR